MKNGMIKITLTFILTLILLNFINSLSSQMFASNSSGMKSKASLDLLKSQIEEKRKLLQMIYSQQLIPNNPQSEISFSQTIQNVKSKPIVEDISKTAKISSEEGNIPENKFNEESSTKESLQETENQEIKPLLKSIVDMQYYTYQMLKKMKNSFDELKKDVEDIKKNELNKTSPTVIGNLEKSNRIKIKLSKEEKLIDP